MGIRIKKPDASSSVGGFDLSSAKPLAQTIIKQKQSEIPLAGPVGFGSTPTKGASIKDIPFVTSVVGSDVLAGVPETAIKQPTAFGLAGPGGATAASITGQDVDVLGARVPKLPFPEPATPRGRVLGRTTGLLASLVGFPGITAGKATQVVGQQATRQAAKTRLLPRVLTKLKERVGRGVEKAQRTLGGRLESAERLIGGQAEEAVGLSQRAAQRTQKATQQAVRGSEQTLKETTQVLKKELKEGARQGVINAQEKVIPWLRKNSDAYEAAVKESMGGSKITRQNVSNAIEETLSKLGIRDEAGRTIIPPEQLSRAERFLLQKSEEFFDIARRGEDVPFDEVIKLKNLVRQTISAPAQAGSRSFTAGDNAASTFLQSIGREMESIIPGLGKINAKYRQFFGVKDRVFKLLKPTAPAKELATKTGEQAVTAAVKETGTATDAAILNVLDQELGTDISQQARVSAQRIQQAETKQQQFAQSAQKRLETKQRASVQRQQQIRKQADLDIARNRQSIEAEVQKIGEEAEATLRGTRATRTGKTVSASVEKRIAGAEQIAGRQARRAKAARVLAPTSLGVAFLEGARRKFGANRNLGTFGEEQ